MMVQTDKELAGCVDHTLLEATAKKEQIKQLCEQANLRHGLIWVLTAGKIECQVGE